MPELPHQRDQRIDLFRGIALVMIFINHIPGTIWESLTSRNFGFSDAAEGFVLMSGIAAGLAYGPAFQARQPIWPAALRPWRRALTIWAVHLLVVALVFALFALLADHPAIAEMAKRRNILRALEEPASYLLPLVLLSHQFAYADILPMYVALMLVAPLILWCAVRAPRTTMAASVALWFVVGLLRIRVPTWPQDNGWFFNPLAWQVLFVAGIVTGLAMRRHRRALPLRPWAVWLSALAVIGAALWVQVPLIADYGRHGLWLLNQKAGFPGVVTAFDKSFVFLPRLLHILALAYLISALPALRGLAAHPRLAPLTLLGRHSLPVFAAGTVLAYGAQVTKALAPPSTLLDTALIGAGLCLLLAVAHLRERQKTAKRAGAVPAA
ncbi:OpgC family protein [Pseudotabrizicola algicola]|uniref:OpgC domain-containing protein n=1 Tax=Pseudotabrizicola algicola TaxID=2709381 RepID=A0A6B3RR77_9RHOB|nr:OpgC domain-containing protein [Pseudotabrizicola algicola]NEX47308.1 OpgC domain-containing protein [Pseudotabrizicola algicola]